MKRHALVIMLSMGLIGIVLRSEALTTQVQVGSRGPDGAAPLGTLKEICDRSPLIIEATVQSEFPAFEAQTSNSTARGPLVTDYVLNVNRVIKGLDPGKQIVIGQLGGTLGGRKEVNDSEMPMAIGLRYILFLKTYAPKTWVLREIPRFTGAAPSASILLVDNSVRLTLNSRLRSLYEGVSVSQMVSAIQEQIASH